MQRGEGIQAKESEPVGVRASEVGQSEVGEGIGSGGDGGEFKTETCETPVSENGKAAMHLRLELC